MIYLADAMEQLGSLERFGLTVLVDASGLLVVETGSERTVTMGLSESTEDNLQQLRIEQGPGSVRVARSALSRIGRLAGAIDEQQSPLRDRHDRVPSEVSPMAAGELRNPLINAAGRMLRDAVVAQSPGRLVRVIAPWPEGKRWAAAFTHDLDVVNGWPAFTGLRLAELARKGEVGLALRVAGTALTSVATDPVGRGVTAILDIERRLSIPSTWFVLAGQPSLRSFFKGDVTYSLDSARARRILDALGSAGHEIGLHGSFATMTDPAAMAVEKDRVHRCAGVPVHGVRQHFLRMRPGLTQRGMTAAGFVYDATYGFPDRNGFRLAAAHPLPGWDQDAARETGLEEVPLIWMDRAQSKYSGIEQPGAWTEEGLELSRICREAEGLWVGLWHPNLTTALGFPGAVEQYERLAQGILDSGPFVGSLHGLVRWRQARRSVRVRRVGADGALELRAATRSEWPLRLEDGRGRVTETLSWPAAA